MALDRRHAHRDRSAVRCWRLVGVAGLAWMLAALVAGPTVAAGACSADSVVLGQLPTFTGATPTNWFNVFGEGLDPKGTWTVTFSVPVMGWPIPPLTYDPKKPQTSISIRSDPSGGFKWTVRTRDKGVDSLTIHVSDGTCVASHVVVLVPNTTTALGQTEQPAFPLLVVLLGASLGALVVLIPSRRPT